MQAVSDAIGFTWAVMQFPGGTDRLARLMIAIAGENLAVGIAGAAYVAYLSSIVAKGYSAVQYALLVLAHDAGGHAGARRAGPDDRGARLLRRVHLHHADRFVAVVLCVLEWMREVRRAEIRAMVAPEAVAAE